MTEMPTRARAAATLVAVIVLAGACVPTPAGRASASPVAPVVSASPVAVASPTGPTPVPSFVRPTPTPLAAAITYVVVSGDTLSSIARRFSTSPLSIAYWNRDTHPSLDPESEGYAPDRIAIGWTLAIIPGLVLDGSDLPDPSPTPDASPPGAPDATGNPEPTDGGVSVVVRHGPRSVDTVALTFDMGGRLDPAIDIMDWLIEADVPATIFPTGQTGTTTEQGLAALEIVADHRELFDLGNHSWSHPDFRDLDADAMQDQLDRTEAAVLAAVNVSTQPWFRPPFGGLDDQVPAVVGAAGWGYTVLWDVDTIDWKPESDGGPTTQAIIDKVVDKAQGGSIVLMHLGGFNTFEALPDIVAGLQAKGLEPVTLGEMFGS
jgi:peptidoglycan/xylan/chitin deacetylase (PgdA/CDA1 family)